MVWDINIWVTMVLVVVSCFIYIWLKKYRRAPKGQKLPPGPRGWPLVGELGFLKKDFHNRKCMELAKIYGPVFRIKVGVASIVILNDLESIKKYFTKREILDRPDNWIFKSTKSRGGVTTMNGQMWLDNRRFCLHALREVGFGRTSMETPIMEEAVHLVREISSFGSSPILVRKLLFPSVSNVITALLFGTRYPFDDPRRKFLDERFEAFFKVISTGTLVNILPEWARLLVRKIPFTRTRTLDRYLLDVANFTLAQAEEHLRTLDEHCNRDFMDGYLKKIKETKDQMDSNFSEIRLVGNVINFYVGGSSPVVTALHWHLLNFAQNQDLQGEVQREIDSVLGAERQATWEDRLKMPFTTAVIREMYRWNSAAALGLPRGASEDTFFGEYFIPKGTVVIPNFWAVHNDPALWRSPEKFDPTRFLSTDASDVPENLENILAFSVGKRMCPGETLATSEIFIFLTTLLQKFHVLIAEGQTVNMDAPDLANLMEAKLRFFPR